MARLSRAESQARTRELLVDTARELFLRDGYSATSLAKVAEVAGFSTGAVYSNFENKSALALVVLDRIQEEKLGEAGVIFADRAGLDEKLDAIREWADRTLDSGWARLELEFALEARADPQLVRALVDREAQVVALVARTLEQPLADLGLDGVVPPKVLAGGLISLAVGLAMQRLVDPKVSTSGLIDLLRSVLGFAAKAR
ncbi:TetR/AcrR family transcriptional regulator [Amycolatopsis nigrescens]|uniref:TetR/AcrR family transcriptional regulator n=1 Tax=Amycolatopsis nigrescens TaxID=381445 RepID=UPI000371F8BE|nr:TetR/AcrR family transcriptional regulator [Amycolatopsis nigrescens]